MSSRAEVEVSYDVDNDFFRLWLDEEMNYTCALWDGARSLEAAQARKLSVLCDMARVTHGQRVLDNGCGWGAALRYLVTARGAAAHGITLSAAQCAEVERRGPSGVTVSLTDYRDYRPPADFDAVVCICMMEHIATPEQARRGEHLGLYRDFFRRVHSRDEAAHAGFYERLPALSMEQAPEGTVADFSQVVRAFHTCRPSTCCRATTTGCS